MTLGSAQRGRSFCRSEYSVQRVGSQGNSKATENRLKSQFNSRWWIFSIPPLRSPFEGVLHWLAGKTAGRRAELGKDLSEEREFPPLPRTSPPILEHPRSLPSSSPSPCAAAPASPTPTPPKRPQGQGGNQGGFSPVPRVSPSWGQKERMNNCTDRVRAQEVRR